jgi:SAM-dependent methyltransferase
MLPFLTAIYNAWWRRFKSESPTSHDAVVWLEPRTATSPRDVVRSLRSSTHWLRLHSIHECEGVPSLARFQRAAMDVREVGGRGDGRAGEIVHVFASRDPAWLDAMAALASRCGHAWVDGRIPPPPGLANDFAREVSHHDFELGGKNEWDGAPSRYAEHTLRVLSATHCHDAFPRYAIDDLSRLRARLGGSRALDVLDVGCGPVTQLRWGALQGWLRVLGADPLLDMYRVVLARHGLDSLPHLMVEDGWGCGIEDLPHDASARFDVVYTSNALDHTQDPLRAIQSLCGALRPGQRGLVIIQVATNEGTRQGWDQLHKFDMRIDGKDQFVAIDQRGKRLVLAGAGTPLRIVRVVEAIDANTTLIAERADA